MGYGLWASRLTSYGLWAMGYGLWAMGLGLWAMGYGAGAMGYGLWAMGYGLASHRARFTDDHNGTTGTTNESMNCHHPLYQRIIKLSKLCAKQILSFY